jgi:methionine biosynthesis protein MetW
MMETVLRPELLRIADMVPPGSRVLDVGCGHGELIGFLAQAKGADARGIELSQAGVNACVARGLPVVQGDADTDLCDYPSRSFDIVILSQTIQATRRPRDVLNELLRIGRNVIVSFPNFGFWRVRARLFFSGRMPQTGLLSHNWYDTPNIHLCTVADFMGLADAMGARIDMALAVDGRGEVREVSRPGYWDNLMAETAIFVLSRPGNPQALV